MEIRINCPNCGSGSVKKSRAVFEQGTSNTRSVSHTGWVSRGGSGSSGSVGRSTRQSGAAARNAPVRSKREAQVFCLTYAATFLAFFNGLDVELMPSALIALYFGFVSYWIARFFNRHYRRRLKEVYEKQWYCSKCGDTFLRDNVASA
jgi:ribosomal protein S27AE